MGITLPTLLTIICTVATLMGTGFLVARRLKMYPIDRRPGEAARVPEAMAARGRAAMTTGSADRAV
jgi:Na+/citrate or Na+/malate symporter